MNDRTAARAGCARSIAALVVAGLLPVAACLAPVEALEPAAAVLRLLFAAIAPGLGIALCLEPPAGLDPARLVVRALALSPLVAVALSLPPALAFGLGPAELAGPTAWLVCVSLAALAWWLRSARAGETPPPLRIRWSRLALALGPALGLAAVVAWTVAPVGARFSYHGYLHAGVVAQLAAGMLPPENPALAGEPIGFYWPFHWWLAVQAALARVSVLEVSPAVNAAALVVYVGATQRILASFLSPRAAAVGALAAGFAGSLLLPVVLALRVAGGQALPSGFVWPFEWLQVGGLGGDPRPLPLLGKFLNMGGTALGLGLWAAVLAELAPPADAVRLRAIGSRERVVVFLLLVGMLLLHLTTALAAFASLPVALAVLAWTAPAGTPRAARGVRRLWKALATLAPEAAVFAAALAVASPFVWSVTVGTHAGGVGPWAVPIVIAYNARTVLLDAAPLALATLAGFMWLRRDPQSLFLATTALVLLVLGVLAQLPDHNQYKFPLAAGLPGGLLLFRLLSADGPIRSRPARRFGMAAVVGLALAGHALTVGAYRTSAMAGRRTMAGDGLYLALPGRPAVDGALRWLRLHSPPDAVVVTRPGPFGGSPVAAVSGRNVFAMLGHPAHDHPAARPRMASVMALLREGGGVGEGDDAASVATALAALRRELDRPLFVLLTRAGDGAAYDALRARFARARDSLVLVYEADDAALYSLEAR